MSQHPADFRVEIIKGRPQGIRGIQFLVVDDFEFEFNKDLDPPGEIVDVTDYVDLEAMGSVNRALERDLLSFKTGDLTLGLLNHTGFFDDLFAEAVFGPTTIWSLRVTRRGVTQFWGVLIGLGSIVFDRREQTVEVTAYGLTKLLDRTDARLVRRAFAIMTVTTATVGSASLTLNSTFNLLTGDVLHLTDHVNSEDVTVKQVISATVVQLEANLGHTYAGGSAVTNKTPFHRYKTIAYLAERIYKAAFIGLADLRLSESQFKNLAPTPQNLSGLPAFNGSIGVRASPAEKDGREYITNSFDGTFYQESPDAAWVDEGGANVKPWIDWSPYYLESDMGPAFVDRTPYIPGNPGESRPQGMGFDSRGSTHILYVVNRSTRRLQKRTSTDGETWTAEADVTTPNVPRLQTTFDNQEVGCTYDPVRNQVLVWSSFPDGAGPVLQLYDVGGATWTDLQQADDGVTHRYGGFSYCRDLDLYIGLRATVTVGPAFEIVAFRGPVRVWKRTFPNVLIRLAGGTSPALYPTRTLRYVRGGLYCVAEADGYVQLVASSDEFQTHTIRKIVAPGTTGTIETHGGRVKGTYAIVCYDAGLPRGYFVAAPFYAGVIKYADFEGLTGGEALNKLAPLANAHWSVDDDLQGHFVARDKYDPGAVTDIDDLVLEETEDTIWDQTSQYVTVSGGGFEATAGDQAFAAEGIEIESSFIPNEAFCQALADAFFHFYSQARVFPDALLVDLDGHIYRPLDRVRRNGRIELVYESDHDLVADEVRVSRVENR